MQCSKEMNIADSMFPFLRIIISHDIICSSHSSLSFNPTVASQAEMDHFHYLRRQTAARVLRSCSGEMEREVHSILGPLGVNEALSRLVAEDLRVVEEDVWGDRVGETQGQEGVVRAASPKRETESKKGGWLSKLRGKRDTEEEDGGSKAPERDEDMGLTAFILKFGEGMGEC